MHRAAFLQHLMIGLLLAGGLARLWFVFQPFAFLLDKIVPDDAFYYATIAWNFSRGLGFSFDGITQNNGFHPLWALSLTPFYALFADKFTALRVTLALGVLLDLGAGWMLASLAEKFRPGSRLPVLGLYMFNPHSIIGAVNGLETAMLTFTLAAFLTGAGRAWCRPSGRSFALLGLLAGLAFLGRTDVAFVLLAVGGGLLLELLVNRRVAWRALLGWSAVAAAVAGLTVLPWYLWNLLTLHTLVQSSAVAIPEYIRSTLPHNPDYWQEFQASIINFSLRHAIIYPGVSWLILLAAALYGRMQKLRQAQAAQAAERPSPLPLFLIVGPLLGALAIIAVHTFLRWFSRSWYFPPLAVSVIFLGGITLAQVFKGLPSRAVRGVLAVLVVLVGLHSARTLSEASYPGQVDMLMTAEWFQENTPEDSVVGAFNAGILGFYADRTVINLDGVVDWGSIQARRDGRILAYLKERGGDYLADKEAYVYDQFGPFLGPEAAALEEVAQIGDPQQWLGPLWIYQVH